MIPVQDPLDDGISKVELVDFMGSDLSVVNAARVSFDKQSEAIGRTAIHTSIGTVDILELSEADKKLTNYLAKHNHWTPFGHAQVSLRVKAPIFIARQLVKHQVGLVWNEVSRRYVSDTPQVYYPSTFREAPTDGAKQGSSSTTTMQFTLDYERHCADAVELYEKMLAVGIAPEEARMVLPLSSYTEWVWSGSLAAWLRIIKLRVDPHAQSQTRQYGIAFSEVIKELFPVSYEANLGNLASLPLFA